MAPRISDTPDRPPSATPDEGARTAAASPIVPVVGPMDGHLDHLAELATMVSLLERLPEAAEDIRRWRRGGEARLDPSSEGQSADPLRRAYGDLDPLIRRAFDAVVAGLDKLAESAVDLCARTHDPPQADAIEACAEIGAAMRQLLERALAIADSARPRSAAAPARFRELRMRRKSDHAPTRQ